MALGAQEPWAIADPIPNSKSRMAAVIEGIFSSKALAVAEERLNNGTWTTSAKFRFLGRVACVR
jgi:hypothetical protein